MYKGFTEKNLYEKCGSNRTTEMRFLMNRIKSFRLLLTGMLVFTIILSSSLAFAQAPKGGGAAPSSAPATPAAPKVQTGAWEITVLGVSGAPESGVTVTAYPVGVQKGRNTKTNTAGLAVLNKQEYGIYHIVGRKSGFEPAFQQYVVLDSAQKSLTLQLKAGADRKLYFEDAALDRRAGTLLNEGLNALQAGNAVEAERLISQSIEIKPLSPDALYYHGLAMEMQEKDNQAIESFKKAIDTANFLLSMLPSPKPPMMGMGGPGGAAPKPGAAPGPGGAAPKPGAGGPGGAPKPSTPSNRQIFETIIMNAEDQIVTISLIRAETAYSAKRFDEAIALYDEAIKTLPKAPILHSGRALALVQAGRLEDALASANRAVELNPGDERSGQVKKAVDAFVENSAREKENALRQQANTLIKEGDSLLGSDAAAALKKYEEANALTGNSQAVIWRQIGRARAKLKQDTEADAAFRRAIELSAADQIENYQMALAQFYLDTKRPEEALNIVVAGAANPELRLMELFNKAKNSPDQETTAFSTAALERVLKLNPSNFEAVFELGQVYYMDRKDESALEMLNRYIENGKDEARIQTAKDFVVVITNRINRSKQQQ